jgi:hypothetical protein
MFALGKMTAEIEARQKATGFLNLATALVGIWILGVPLTPVAVRVTLFCWMGLAVAATQSFSERCQVQYAATPEQREGRRSEQC